MTPRVASRGSTVPAALLVFLVSTAVFLPALDNGFLAWDDDVNFTMNPHFRGFSAEHLRWMFGGFHVGHYMPLTWLSAALDHALWGMDPWGYHLTNVLLHATGALLAYLVLARLFALLDAGRPITRSTAAAAGALFFALHPLRVESVAWVTERRDVLSGALLLASLLAWLEMQRVGARRHAWYAASVALFAMSLLSKVSGMALPVVLLLVDAWLLGRRAWREKLPYFALAAGGALLGYLGQRESTEVLAGLDRLSIPERLVQAGFALAFYVRQTVLPRGLSPFYEQRSGLSPAPLAVVVLCAVAARLAARRGSTWARTLWCALASYAVLALPVIGLVQAGRQVAADRYTYVACLPLAALFAAAVLAAAKRGRTGAFASFAAGAVLVLLAGVTRGQIGYWHDTETLFRRVVAVEPDNYLGHRKLGIALHEQGRYDEAIAEYEQCLCIRPDRHNDDAWSSLALSYYERGAPGDVGRTLDALDAALRDNPRQRLAWSMFEELNVRSGDTEKVIGRLGEVLAEAPDFTAGHVALARLLTRTGRNEEAIECCRRALALEPDEAEAYNLWGLAEANLGAYESAAGHFRRALELHPERQAYRDNLDYVLAR